MKKVMGRPIPTRQKGVVLADENITQKTRRAGYTGALPGIRKTTSKNKSEESSVEQKKTTPRGIATTEQLEKRLSSIALGRVKKPDEAKITEQLKAMELLVKIRGLGQEEQAEPMEVKIRVLDSSGKEIRTSGV